MDFGMTIVIDSLKWLGQEPNSKYALAMKTMFFKHDLFLMIHLRCLHNTLSGPEADELQQLIIA